ncbi:MAG: type II toxin-antitoxin system HicA family toxin [Candidatus Sumerlaeia bacterium]|nr:type II toxin-antitoxin system HicA family toxin [Candidatus Sumerlaeia bacterium]
MGRVPALKPREVLKALGRAGFVVDRMRGSHAVLLRENPKGMVVVPVHPGDIDPGLLRAIIRQAGLEPDDFLKLLD